MIKVILNNGKVFDSYNVIIDNDKIIIERSPIVVSKDKISHVEVARGEKVETYIFTGKRLNKLRNHMVIEQNDDN